VLKGRAGLPFGRGGGGGAWTLAGTGEVGINGGFVGRRRAGLRNAGKSLGPVDSL